MNRPDVTVTLTADQRDLIVAVLDHAWIEDHDSPGGDYIAALYDSTPEAVEAAMAALQPAAPTTDDAAARPDWIYDAASPERKPISEAAYEKMADARVMRRLNVDPRYRHAENAEAKAEAEAAIEREVIAALDAEYRIII